MATLEFQIPLSREELTERGERVQYVVSEQCTANELTPRLDGEGEGAALIELPPYGI